MSTSINFLSALVFAIVVLCWLVFGSAFFLLQWTDGSADRKRQPASLIGFGLQIAGLAVVWVVHRPWFTPLTEMGKVIEILLAAIAIASSMVAAWMAIAAIRALGKQWSLTARVIENHELIMTGPYRLVRHPIYTALLGMVLATGLAQSYWWGLLAALAIYLAGTLIRIRSEERLLREVFGARYEDFARRVPALIPGVY
jgi:protein-S-isoprenylcysteine O-methyltransferase Ste14